MHHNIKGRKTKQLVEDVADIFIGPQPSTFPKLNDDSFEEHPQAMGRRGDKLI